MSNPRSTFLVRVLQEIDKQPYGVGLTKTEIAKKFNCTSHSVVDKWGRLLPEIKSRIVYVKINNGRHKQAVYVAKKHKAKLIETGLALENY